MVCFVGCNGSETPTEPVSDTPLPADSPQAETPPLPEHVILADEIQDNANKAQVLLRVQVSPFITDDELERLLRGLFASAIARGPFRFYQKPTNVYIYVYRDPADIDQGNWVGMLQSGPDAAGASEPTIQIGNPCIL